MSVFLATHTRTHSCGSLRAADVGKLVVLTRWGQSYRDHGGVVFVDLRDREGLTQLRFDPTFDKTAHEGSGSVRAEWCVGIVGEVRARGTTIDAKSGKERSLPGKRPADQVLDRKGFVDHFCLLHSDRDLGVDDGIDASVPCGRRR